MASSIWGAAGEAAKYRYKPSTSQVQVNCLKIHPCLVQPTIRCTRGQCTATKTMLIADEKFSENTKKWSHISAFPHRLVRPEHPKQISENVVAFLRFDFRGNKVIDLSPVLSFIFPNPHTAQADYHVFSIPWRFSWVGLVHQSTTVTVSLIFELSFHLLGDWVQ